jgi:hypothetical protein
MFPDRFAGIVPVCGATDIRVWEQQWLWKTPEDSPIRKVRDFLRDDTSSLTYAENLEHVSVVCLQGVCDPIVNELQAKHMQDALKAFGHTKNEFHFFPYVMHSFSVNYNVALQNFVREERPLHVRYKTAWLKYPGAYWLKIGAIEQRLKHATIDGTADPKKHAIKIKTINATQISIERERLPFGDPLARVTIDGDSIESPPEKSGAYSFVRLKGKWSVEKEKAKSTVFPPQKNQHIEGPAEHAFMSRFLLVADSGETPMLEAIDDAAETFNDHWRQRYAVPARRKRPSEVTDQDIADSNLILFGRPEDNALTAKVIGKLPASFDGEKIKLGDKTYSGPNAGAILCYPNPLNPERYVVLIAGTTPLSYIDINVRFGNWFDWVPYDFRKHYDFAVFDDLTSGRNPESFLVWGFFDEGWNFSDTLTFAAVKSFREKLLPRVFPKIAAETEDKPDVLWLDDAFTDGESITKEYLERNRTLEGHVLKLVGKEYKRGLCCRFPCWLTFNCEGYSRLKLSAGVGWDGVTEPCDDRKQFEKVRVLVQGDGKTLYEALERTYKNEPCEIDVDLNGASTITLSATGGLAWLNGSFVWANARLER